MNVVADTNESISYITIGYIYIPKLHGMATATELGIECVINAGWIKRT